MGDFLWSSGSDSKLPLQGHGFEPWLRELQILGERLGFTLGKDSDHECSVVTKAHL